MERSSLEEKLKELEAQKESPISTEDQARELVQQFLDSAYTSRELLVSLIERVELTENKQIIIKFLSIVLPPPASIPAGTPLHRGSLIFHTQDYHCAHR